MESQGFGLLLLLFGAICGGSFGLPSKFVKKDTPWETLWGPFFFFVAILLPTTVFPLIAKGLFTTCGEAGWAVVKMTVLFGFLWGLGSMTLGLSFAFIGLSLAYAINYGAQIATGGFGGFVIHNSDQLATPHGLTITAGVVVCIVGVVICGKAAMLKSTSQADDGDGEQMPTGSKLTKGLIVAFISGVLCACYGLAFGFGGKIMQISMESQGNPGWRAAFVVSALILWGGSLSACGYCVFKLCKNNTWGTLTAPGIGKVLIIALIMACLHDGAILFYGVGASKLGPIGAAVGYAVFMSFAIMVGNVNGFLTGEWKGASKQSVNWIIGGIVVLMLGVSVLARGNYMHGTATATSEAQVEQEAVTE
ncbi:MAG: L-rhamnose/proton symporter RhaT [Kiritimatiellia bacterium]|jgi:L-rhamnose-H+ transport protein|nr:L-rhamnose/proton symporter RhaT [Kiritimatiellia bacterium]